MNVIIMAGGKGTRIAEIAEDIPKPMIRVCEKPILEHQISSLKEQGFTDIILVIGHLGHIIKEYFKDGSEFGVNIDYIEEQVPLGTAGALYFLKDKLKEDFLLINGDIIFDINFQRFIEYHKNKGGWVTLLTHPNNHPYDSAIIVTDKDSKVVNWLHKEDKREIYKNRVNAGIHILSTDIFNSIAELRKMDLDRDILKPLISSGKLFAYDSPEYIKDMGTPERYHMVCSDLKKGTINAKSLRNKQRAIFLDRDGTINVHSGFINKPEQIVLKDGVAEAISKVNNSGYLTIIITNQPVIARGECTLEQLDIIHDQLETLLGERGAFIDDIYFCPHHPDKGFEGERLEYKVECDCRKPKPGLIFKAAQEYNIDLLKSYMIGDSINDIKAGIAAGCKVALIQEGHNEKRKLEGIPVFNTLLECTNEILKNE